MIFETLNKRKHVYEYKDNDVPALDTIKDIMHKAWQVTPSKQNIMPYKVSVLGPNSDTTKQKIYNKVVGNDQDMSAKGFDEGVVTKIRHEINPHYRHILHNPYLVVFSQRVCTDKDINPFYKRQIDKGHFMEQTSEKWVENIKSTTAFEVGLFAQSFSALCLDQGIDCSFTGCFPGRMEKWKNIDFVEHPVIMLMSLGKAKVYRRDFLDQNSSDLDYKTAFENVVKFEE